MRKKAHLLIGVLVGTTIVLKLLVDMPKPIVTNVNTIAINVDDEENYHIDTERENNIVELSGYRIYLPEIVDKINSSIEKRTNNNPMFLRKFIPEPVVVEDNNEDVGVNKDIDNPGEIKDMDFMETYNKQFNEIKDGKAIGYNKETSEKEEVSIQKAIDKHRPFLKKPLDEEHMKKTSGFGIRKDPFSDSKASSGTPFHTGLDLASKDVSGANIYSVSHGRVKEIHQKDTGYGNLVIVEYGDFDVYYAHMSNIREGLREGDLVEAGQVLGYVGSTGRSTGPHLHIEFNFGNVAVSPELIIGKVN